MISPTSSRGNRRSCRCTSMMGVYGKRRVSLWSGRRRVRQSRATRRNSPDHEGEPISAGTAKHPVPPPVRSSPCERSPSPGEPQRVFAESLLVRFPSSHPPDGPSASAGTTTVPPAPTGAKNQKADSQVSAVDTRQSARPRRAGSRQLVCHISSSGLATCHFSLDTSSHVHRSHHRSP